MLIALALSAAVLAAQPGESFTPYSGPSPIMAPNPPPPAVPPEKQAKLALAGQMYDAVGIAAVSEPMIQQIARDTLNQQAGLPGFKPEWRPRMELTIRGSVAWLRSRLRQILTEDMAEYFTEKDLRLELQGLQKKPSKYQSIPLKVRTALDALRPDMNIYVHNRFCLETSLCAQE
jgi:hypothetical protein